MRFSCSPLYGDECMPHGVSRGCHCVVVICHDLNTAVKDMSRALCGRGKIPPYPLVFLERRTQLVSSSSMLHCGDVNYKRSSIYPITPPPPPSPHSACSQSANVLFPVNVPFGRRCPVVVLHSICTNKHSAWLLQACNKTPKSHSTVQHSPHVPMMSGRQSPSNSCIKYLHIMRSSSLVDIMICLHCWRSHAWTGHIFWTGCHDISSFEGFPPSHETFLLLEEHPITAAEEYYWNAVLQTISRRGGNRMNSDPMSRLDRCTAFTRPCTGPRKPNKQISERR